MRTIIWIVVGIIVLVAAWQLLKTQPPQDLPQAQVTEGTSETTGSGAMTQSDLSGTVVKEKSTFSFTGYGPGKSHTGTFAWTPTLTVVNDALAGSVSFDTASVKTENPTLDTHLCTEDFFNCAVNKQITFTVTEASATEVTGTLTFARMTHTVTFPVVTSGNTITADFRLDRTPFNFTYTLANVTAVDKEVRLQFVLAVE